MTVELTDGRALSVPLAWFPRLLQATSAQRAQVEVSRLGLHWEQLDEDISIAGLLAGRGDITKRDVRVSASRVATKMRYAAGDHRVFIERRPDGDYAVRRANSKRPSDVLPTQREAIERARELSPSGSLHVERVRNTSTTTDKWRKA
jgi:Protein of unknown function (DUF2442)/Uncharacterized protein conserved in bacteria (DUF2188)